jgi:16S rRNA processing protein RimM
LNQVSSGSLILVGRVNRPHGLEGVLRIWPYAGNDASFLKAKTVILESLSGKTHEYGVAFIKRHKNIFLLKLKGVDSPDVAEEYRGAEIYVRKEELTHEEGEYFWDELLNLDVYLDTGKYLGILSQVIPAEGHDIYAVTQGDREILIPAVHEVVIEIDIKKGRIVVSAEEVLLDLDEV